ncbi:MAG: dockerin type I repeat-containing protein [Clostridia bacterium]|nr:dockerin type I repeat-containing protein [Clostridia bacterium]
MKKLFALLMSFAMVLSMAVFASAEEVPFAGSGTEEDPYIIATVADLTALSDAINSDADGVYYGAYFKQTADLDLSGIENWIPIGYDDLNGYYFLGHYDGGNHWIKNMTSTNNLVEGDDDMFASLFGIIYEGSVSNLHMVNAKCTAVPTGDEYIAGFAAGIAGAALVSTFENCSVVDSVFSADHTKNNLHYAGGVVGWLFEEGCSMTACSATNCTVSVGSWGYGGGVAGEYMADYYSSEMSMTDCYAANCTVTTVNSDDKARALGGVVGEACCTFTLKNTFAYDCTVSDAATFSGPVYGELYAYGNEGTVLIAENNYYNAETAPEEDPAGVTYITDAAFLTLDLGEAYTAGEKYPVLVSAPALPQAIAGDVDASGTVDTADAILVMQYLVGNLSSLELTVADLNGDGKITIYDAVEVLRIISA